MWDDLRQRYVLYTRNRTVSNREVRRFKALPGTLDSGVENPWRNETIVLRADAMDKVVRSQTSHSKKELADPLDYYG